MHLLFAERLMLSNKQLMLRPSCQPEWGKKAGAACPPKGNGRRPSARGRREPAVGERQPAPPWHVELRAEPGVWVCLRICHSKGIQEKGDDLEPLKRLRRSRGRALPKPPCWLPAPSCRNGQERMSPPNLKLKQHCCRVPCPWPLLFSIQGERYFSGRISSWKGLSSIVMGCP